jgi:ribosome maturation factor RimP
MNWQAVIDQLVTSLGYDLVDCERNSQGLLRVFIDRLPQHEYETGPGDTITIEDCELVTRQLQYVLEVEGCDYQRLEISSPGLDRPLTKESHYVRFCGQEVVVALKMPFEGRKKYRGYLHRNESDLRWEVLFEDGKEDKILGFALDEVDKARLVPVVDFKRRARTSEVDEKQLTKDPGDHKE